MVQAENAVQQNIINGRKTLIIGLGSTGAKVCNQILEKIIWKYNSPENVPWLKCLVFETADVASDRPVRRYAQFKHLTIDPGSYASLIANPETYRESINFPSWDIPNLTRANTGITDGAGGIRIVGRLSLLFPSNYTMVCQSIRKSIEDLQNLTKTEATTAFQRGNDDIFDVALNDDILVFVVGSLCGGTASGCFIDLGYLIQSMRLLKTPPYGLFMLPSAAESDQIILGNAYAALLELNHFSTNRIRYTVKYPGRPDIWSSDVGLPPYKYCYLIQSRSTHPQDYAKLITQTADYIYLDVIGSESIARDGKRKDIEVYYGQHDYWGATQKYVTFGLSSIEFPYAKVMKACSLRLATKGFHEIIGNGNLSEYESNVILDKVLLVNKENLIHRLLKYEEYDLRQLIRIILAESASTACNSDESLDLVRAQIDAAFDGNSQMVHPRLPLRIIPQMIEQNAKNASDELITSIQDTVKSFLTGPEPKGIQGLLSFLENIEISLKQENDNKTAIDSYHELELAVNVSRERVADCRRDFWLGIVMQRRSAVMRYIDEYIDNCDLMYQEKLRVICYKDINHILNEARNLIITIRRRIENSQCGLLSEIQKIINNMNNLYKRIDISSIESQDGWSRVVNGAELFEPDQTISEEYPKCLRETANKFNITGNSEKIERELAFKSVEGYFNNIMPDLLANINDVRRFDPECQRNISEFHDERLLELTIDARKVFQPLSNISVIERLLNRQDISTILAEAKTRSKLALDWNDGSPRYFPGEKKFYNFNFYNENDAGINEFIRFAGNTLLDEHLSVPDRHQILFLREQGAFSLGTIFNLQDGDNSNWISYYNNPPGIDSFHSRGDIRKEDWITWERQDEEKRIRNRNLFLTGVALDIIKFYSAKEYRFEYTPVSPVDPGFIKFNNNLDDVASFMKNTGFHRNIELKIREYRNLIGDLDTVMKISELARTSENKFTETGRSLTKEDIWLYVFEYIYQDTGLLSAYRSIYTDPLEMSYLGKDEQEPIAYYCPGCNEKLGYTIDSLYITESKPGGGMIKMRRCAYCKKDL